MTNPTDPLVEKLRATHGGGMGGNYPMPNNPDGPEAADEIERLQAQGDAVREELASWKSDHRREALRANRAEDRFLRAEEALESIANNTCCGPCQEAKLVARTALAKLEQTGERVE